MNHRVEDILVTRALYTIFVLCLCCGLMYISDKFILVNNCVVEKKSGNKIIVKSLDKKDNAKTVIEFEKFAKGMEYYNNIKVNDTLALNISGNDAVYKNHHFFGKISRIRGINGKTLDEIANDFARGTKSGAINALRQKTR